MGNDAEVGKGICSLLGGRTGGYSCRPALDFLMLTHATVEGHKTIQRRRCGTPTDCKVNELSTLKEVEKSIICFICDGLTNKEIAFKLILKMKTIVNYRKILRDRLEIANIASLVVYAVKTGLYEVKETQ